MIVEVHMVRSTDCADCGELMPEQCCPKSRRPCGHHCDCVWTQDTCHWCGVEFHGDGLEIWPGEIAVWRSVLDGSRKDPIG